MKLLMLKIGATPAGRLIEQHDIMFMAVNDFTQVMDIIDSTWHQAKHKWHIDAWREITRVGDYRIQVINKPDLADPTDLPPTSCPQLYFVNLGGYLPNVFEEFHHKELIVAETLSQAIAQAKKLPFFQDYNLQTIDPLTGINGVSHIDDKMTVALDDIHCVNQLLANDIMLCITPLTLAEKTSLPQDTLHIGYLSRKKIRNFLQ